MLFIFLAFVIISLIGISFRKINILDSTALDKNRTTMINGFFVGVILFSHFNSYVSLNGFTNRIYIKLFNEIGQLMVTTFLFYSGYGIFESIKSKKNYIDNFLKNRVFKLFISFSIAIILYLLLGIAIGVRYSLKTILLSFIGWESVGNSNWFIFATFCLYLFTFLSFKLFKKDSVKGVLLVTILSCFYIMVLLKLNKYSWWWDTIFCYSLGMLVSYYKDGIMCFLKDNYNYILLFFLNVIIFWLCRIQSYNYLVYNIKAMSFVMMVFLLSLKVKFGNSVLFWLGKNTFNIYILQRLSYILYSKIGLVDYNYYVFFAVSVFTTMILVLIFDKLLKRVYKIFNLGG